MPHLHFNSVEEMLAYLPEEERRICMALRHTILDALTGVREKLSYQVPFYSLRKNICFIWPASVLWGKKKTYEGVRIGFTHGHLLDDPDGYLTRGERKYVSIKNYIQLSEEDLIIVRGFLYQSQIIDKELHP